MPRDIPISPTNNNPTITVNLGGDFVFPLALNSAGHETTLLMSASQFMGLYAEGGEEKDEEEYPSDDSSDEDDDTDYASDFSDFFEEYVLDDSDPKTRPASKTAIEVLEKVKIDEELGKSVGMCSVCLEEMAVGTEARRLPCFHVYHSDCITEWLNSCNMCPLCRHKMPVVDFDLNDKMPSDDFES